MKKFIEFINELNYSTYRSASKKLKELGHTKRAAAIDKHRDVHGSKMSLLKNYGDLLPFELSIKLDKNGLFLPGNTDLVTVYLAGWNYIPAVDNDCEAAIICPSFLFNSNQLHIEKSSELNKDHIKGLDEYTEMDYMFQFDYVVKDDSCTVFSFEGTEDYIKFSNRRDAVRFKKILEEDSVFLDNLVDMIKGCEDLSPFYIKKKIVDSYNINKMYIER